MRKVLSLFAMVLLFVACESTDLSGAVMALSSSPNLSSSALNSESQEASSPSTWSLLSSSSGVSSLESSASGWTPIIVSSSSLISKLVDSRDNQEYSIMLIDSVIWMAENLNYQVSESACYNEDDDNCQKYGRLYAWGVAEIACPEGWRLPTSEEFSSAQEKLSNSDEMMNIRGGIYYAALYSYLNMDVAGYYWTASSSGESSAVVWSYSDDGFSHRALTKSMKVSVRCVKE